MSRIGALQIMTERSQTTEIKPCPFCGGNARIVYCGPDKRQIERALAWGEDYDVAYFGECDSCKATSMTTAERSDAEAAWNRRV
jgi:hypothetical protein